MNFGPKSLILFAGFCISSAPVFAQGATCAADGAAPSQSSPIACVTGQGVQVKTAGQNSEPVPGIVPLTPEQMPANPPMVTYENGKLTIVAKNSTLSDILLVVGSKTGALIDVPEGADERVVAQVGPGPAREVMASLLNGSHFNYVMVGTEENPTSVAHVILTAKREGKDGTPGAASSPNAPTVAGLRPYVQPRNALQRAVMQPYQELQEQQQAQAVSTPTFQPPPVAAEEPPAAEPAPQTNGVPTASVPPAVTAPAAGSPTPSMASTGTTETASVDLGPPNESGAPRSANPSGGERSPQQVLQDLYETRRQMMQQQHQPTPQQ